MNVVRLSGIVLLAVSFLLLVALTIGYLGRWDTVAAATFLPHPGRLINHLMILCDLETDPE